MLGLVFFQSIIVASNKLPIYIYTLYIYIYIYRPFRGGWIDYVESYVKNCEDIYYTIQFGGVIIFSNPHLYAYINFMYIYIYMCICVYMFGIQIMTQDEDTVNVVFHCPCSPILPFFTWETRAN